MTNSEIQVLKVNCQLTESALEVITERREQELKNLFTSIFTSSNIPFCKIRSVRISDYPFSDQYPIDFWIEAGFYDEDENKFNFASEFYINYNIKDGIRFNQSNSGYFGREDKFQCLRTLLLAYFITNLDSIEAKCNEFIISCEDFVKAFQERKNAKFLLETATKEFEEAQIKDLIPSFTVGMILTQRSDVSYTKCVMSKTEHIIIKVTPKYVTLKNNVRSDIRLSKETLARALFKNEIVIVSR